MSDFKANIGFSFKTSIYYRLLASANSTTVVELIVELIGELFIVELLNYNFSDFQKACFI